MALHNILRKNFHVLMVYKNSFNNLVFGRGLSMSLTCQKYDQHTVDAIIQWNRENDEIYGPRLKTSKTSRTTTYTSKLAKKKRGRPKKAKDNSDYHTTSHPQSTEDSSTQTGHLDIENIDSKGTNVNMEKTSSPDKTEKLGTPANINGIPLYPLFPPERTEFYVNPPKLPDVYIPGQTERAAFDNPFYPSVGTILSATQPVESRMALKRWRDRLVEELGEEGFNKHKKEIIDRGVEFHASIQQLLEGADRSEISMSAQNEGYWMSASSALKDVSDVQSVERTVIHKQLCYKGQYDCIAHFRDQKVLIDWKTSKKTKADIRYTYDNPLQVVAYVGANNYYDDNMMIDAALIVVCYEDGQPAHTHLLSRAQLIDYWTQWLWRLHQYWAEKLNIKVT